MNSLLANHSPKLENSANPIITAHTGNGPHRVPELFEAFKLEFDSLLQEFHSTKLQRDELEKKRLMSQLNEMALFKQALKDLQSRHEEMKTRYEEEITALHKEQRRSLASYEKETSSISPTPVLEVQVLAPISTMVLDNACDSEETKVVHGLDLDNLSDKHKTKHKDFIAYHNPSSSTSVEIELDHTLTHSSVVCCVQFSPDGTLLATGCNKTAQIYDVASGELLSTLTADSFGNNDLYMRCISFSPDGRCLATGAEDKIVRIWDISSQKVLHVLLGHEQDIYSLGYSTDGQIIASGSGDGCLNLWQASSGVLLNTLTTNPGADKESCITSLSICPNNKLIAGGSLDHLVRIWHLQSASNCSTLQGHQDSIFSVCFSSCGEILFSGSLDKTIRVWQLKAGNEWICTRILLGHKDVVLSMSHSLHNNLLLSASKDRYVLIWNSRTLELSAALHGHKNSVFGVSISPAGTIFATSSGDCTAKIWSFKSIEQKESSDHITRDNSQFCL